MTAKQSSLPIQDAQLAAELAKNLASVESALADAVKYLDPFAEEVTGHLLKAGGKRLRPLLTLLTAGFGEKGITNEVISAAVVVELTHLATLYHDDVMDSAPVRRGVPAAHEVWDNSVAILAGDLLFARASQEVANLGPAAVKLQAETFERLCLGQLNETVGPKPESDAIGHHLQVLSDKTASLLATAARFGAGFAGANEQVVEAVAQYGEKIGVAFQIADDVIDLTSSEEQSGKTPGTDLREHVPTMPVLLLRKLVASPQGTHADVALLELLDSDLSSDEKLAEAVTALQQHQVLQQTKDLAKSWAAEAVAAISSVPESKAKAALFELADYLVERTN